MTTKVKETPTVGCELCGNETPMLGTKRCDRCWELGTRITDNPQLAQRILASLTTQPPPVSGGEWRLSSGNPRIVIDRDGQLVAECRPTRLNGEAEAEQRAAQIVADRAIARDAGELQDFLTKRLNSMNTSYEQVITERNEALLLLIETRRVLLALGQSEAVSELAECIRQYLAASSWAEAKAAAREGADG